MSISAPTKWTRVVAPVAAAACAVAVAVPASSASSGTHQASTSSSRQVSQNSGYASHVQGTFGQYGRVTGHFKPLRSIVRNGQTFVQGDLSTTLRRSNGQLVGRATRHDVALPVRGSGAHQARTANAAASQATCNILHLVLGPLNLNLLGLTVHLNRVVLDITAVSGSGNLLGNLLCAVAHLLDNVSPTLTQLLQLANLLNRIISQIT